MMAAPVLHSHALTPAEREALQGAPWFAGLSLALRHDLLRGAGVQRFQDREPISGLIGPCEAWRVCVRGAVRLSTLTHSGQGLIQGYLGPGDWFGDVALLGETDPVVESHAQGPTTVVRIEAEAFKALLGRHPELALTLLRESAARTRRLMEQVDDLKAMGLGPRLAKQLWQLAQRHGVVDGHQVRITLRLCQHELAQLLGASRQRINEQLKRLEQLDAIRREPGQLVVRDSAALRRLGMADPA